MTRILPRSTPLLAALALLGLAGAAQPARAQSPYGAPAAAPEPSLFNPYVRTYYGPSPFAVAGSAYGLSGYGYFYDQPTEHRFGPASRPRRTAALRRRPLR